MWSLRLEFRCKLRVHKQALKQVDPATSPLVPVYMEKSCPGQEGHPPSRVNFTERLYEKKIDPFAGAKS